MIRTKFSPYRLINLFGLLIVRRGESVDSDALRHEKIHSVQMKELFYVFFYLFYALEWVAKGFDRRKISFEVEADTHEWDRDYLKNRELLAWRRYLWTL